MKEIRKGNKRIISDIAREAGVTSGLISRIENGRTIPSLPVFLKILNALGIEAADFFQGMTHINGGNYIITRREENSRVEKEDEAVGFAYDYIFGRQITTLGFESVLLTIEPNSKREKVTTDAFEFKYLLLGECYYIIDEEEVLLKEGDSIFFDGRIPHVPINRAAVPAKMLVFYLFV